MANPKRIVCPDCGEPIEATVRLDCDVDPETGVITRANSGGSVDLYCSNDCGWNHVGGGGELGSDSDWAAIVTLDDLKALSS